MRHLVLQARLERFGADLRESHELEEDLLTRMAHLTEARPDALSAEVSAAAMVFFAFRHFFLHAYPMR